MMGNREENGRRMMLSSAAWAITGMLILAIMAGCGTEQNSDNAGTTPSTPVNNGGSEAAASPARPGSPADPDRAVRSETREEAVETPGAQSESSASQQSDLSTVAEEVAGPDLATTGEQVIDQGTAGEPAPSPLSPSDSEDFAAQQQRLAELRRTGAFMEGRTLAEEYAATAADSEQATYFTKEALRFREHARSSLAVKQAIELLNGNAVEQRHARSTLFTHADTAVVLLLLDFPDADPDLAMQMASMLAVLGAEESVLPLVSRLQRAAGDPEQADLADHLVAALAGILTTRADKGETVAASASLMSRLSGDPQLEQALSRRLIDVIYGALDSDERIDALFAEGFADQLHGMVRTVYDDRDGPHLDWALSHAQRAGLALPGFHAVWFANRELSDPPVLEQRVEELNWADGDGSQFPIASSQDISGRFMADLVVPESGEYTFYTTSDDGSRLMIDDVEVVDNWGMHGMEEQSGALSLQAGQRYRVVVEWVQGGGGAGLIVEVADPSGQRGLLDGRLVSVVPWEGLSEEE